MCVRNVQRFAGRLVEKNSISNLAGKRKCRRAEDDKSQRGHTSQHGAVRFNAKDDLMLSRQRGAAAGGSKHGRLHCRQEQLFLLQACRDDSRRGSDAPLN